MVFTFRIAISFALTLPAAVGPKSSLGSEKGPWPEFSLSVSADGQWLAAGGHRVSSNRSEKWVRLIELASGRDVRNLRVPSGSHVLRSLAFAPDGTVLAWGDYGRVHLFEVASGTHLNTLRGYESNFDSVAFSPNGLFIAGANADKQVIVWSQTPWWDTESAGPAKLQLGPHAGPVSSVAFWPLSNLLEDSPRPIANGEAILATAAETHVYLWNVEKGQKLHEFKSPADRYVRDLAWSPDGTLLAACGEGYVWLMHGISRRDADPGQTIRQIDLEDETSLLEVHFAPDGRTIAARDAESIRIWETGIYENQSGKLLQVISPHFNSKELGSETSLIHSFAFLPDGKSIVFSHDLGEISVAELATGETRELSRATQNSPAEEGTPTQNPAQPEQPRQAYLLQQIQGLLKEAESLRAQGRLAEARQHREKAAYRAAQLAAHLRQPLADTPKPAENLVANGSFEQRSTGDPPQGIATLQPGSDQLAGWEVFDPSSTADDGHKPRIVDWIGPERWKASQGEYCLDIDGGIRQHIASVADATYVVQFDLAGNPETDYPIQQMLHVQCNGQTYVFTFDPAGNSISDLKWDTRHVVFTAKEPRTAIGFLNAHPNVHSAGVALDNVSVRMLDESLAKSARELFERSERFDREARELRTLGRNDEARQHAEAAARYRSRLKELVSPRNH